MKFFSHTVRHLNDDPLKRREEKSRLSKDAYRIFLEQKDKNRFTVQKRVSVFVWNNAPFVVDELYDGKTGNVQTFLRFDQYIDGEICTPEFIETGEDISDNEQFHVFN